MNPEDQLRRFNDRAEWNARLTPRADAFPARRRMSPWIVSLATVAAIAVVIAVVFASFGLSVQSLRAHPLPAALTSESPSPSGLPGFGPSPSPSFPPGTTPSCSNVVSAGRVASFAARGLERSDGDFVPAKVASTQSTGEVTFATIAAEGGFVCGYADTASSEPVVIYGFGYLDPARAATLEAKLTTQGYAASGDHEFDSPTGSHGGAFWFGDHFWAYALDGDDQSSGLLSEVVNTGSAMDVEPPITYAPTSPPPTSNPPAARPATPAHTPYLTTDGLGSLRLGARVPADNPYGTLAKSCWTSKPGVMAQSVTARTDGFNSPSGKLLWIVIRGRGVPTKSGVRVGDSLATLEATFPSFDKTEQFSDTTGYEVKGTRGTIVFEVANVDLSNSAKANTVVAIAAFANPRDIGTVISTDAFSNCPA